MYPVLQVGPAAIQTPGLIILISLWLGLSLAEKLATRYRVDANTLYNLVWIGLVSGLIGARLVYAISHLDIFIKSPISLFSLNAGLTDPIGGASLGVVAMSIFGTRKKLTFWSILDAITPLLAVLGIGMGLAHLASGDSFGMETNLPWGIQLWGAQRHPSQIYEILTALFILWIIWPRKRKAIVARSESGITFLSFLALTAGSRLFLEAFRGDSLIIFGNIRVVQIFAWLVLILSLWGIKKIGSKEAISNTAPLENNQIR